MDVIASHPEFRLEGSPMRRREFITFLGSAAVAWPLAARAQQGGEDRPYSDFGTQLGLQLGESVRGISVQGFEIAAMWKARTLLSSSVGPRRIADRLPELAAELVRLKGSTS